MNKKYIFSCNTRSSSAILLDESTVYDYICKRIEKDYKDYKVLREKMQPVEDWLDSNPVPDKPCTVTVGKEEFTLMKKSK